MSDDRSRLPASLAVAAFMLGVTTGVLVCWFMVNWFWFRS